MPVGFGFGVGDFIATINLFKNVASALKDHGGARDDYNKTLSRLETTSAVLSCLEALDSPTGDAATLNAIRGLAHVIRKDVDDFQASIEKYRVKLLQSRGTKKHFSSAVAKIKWSQFVANEVTKLYQGVQIHTTSLDLLLTSHNIHASGSSVHEQEKARALQADSNNANLGAQGSTLKSVEHGLSDLNAHLDLLKAKATITTDQIMLDIAKKHEELKTLVASTGHQPNHSQGLMLALTIPRLNLSTRDIVSLLSYLSEEVEQVVKLFVASFVICFKDLLLAIPQMVLLYRVLRRLPQAISLVLHDNITFEDALGRVQSLQFQQFKHWPVFEASLRCKFEGLPGTRKVLDGKYVLTSPKCIDILDAKNWSRSIQPGIVVKMAISFSEISTLGKRCPRGCESEPSRVTDIEYCCKDCHLTFALDGYNEPALHAKTQTEVREFEKELPHHTVAQINSLRHAWRPVGPKVDIEEVEDRTASFSTENQELQIFKRIHISNEHRTAFLSLIPTNGTFKRKQINVPFFPDTLRIGRSINESTVPTPLNGIFDTKVVSRQHADVWAERDGTIWIRDVKSSNGTYINGQRLSPENKSSEPHRLLQHDVLEFGIDWVKEDGGSHVVIHKASARVEYAGLSDSSNPKRRC